jgi:hypothetical protein
MAPTGTVGNEPHARVGGGRYWVTDQLAELLERSAIFVHSLCWRADAIVRAITLEEW